MSPSSRLSDAVRTHERHVSEEHAQACIEALSDGVVFVCMAEHSAMERTGDEPAFQLARVRGRPLLLIDAGPSGRQLPVFSNRAAAEAWSRKRRGYVAEPIQGATAAEYALHAEAEGMVIDPLGVSIVVTRNMMEWGRCPRRPFARLEFADAVATWNEHRSVEGFDEMMRAFRDGTFYVQVWEPVLVDDALQPAPRVEGLRFGTVCGRELLLDVQDGTTYLTANTERTIVEQWSEGTELVCLAVDGPALAEAAAQLGADVGIMIGPEKSLALGANDLSVWPRRSLTADDF